MLRKGRAPWAPSVDASNVDDLLYYDRPLIGTFVSGETTYLFDCLFGQAGKLALWTYTPLTPAEVEALEEQEFDDAKAIASWAFKLSRHRAKSVGLSWRDRLRVFADVDADNDMLGCCEMLLKWFDLDTKSLLAESMESQRRSKAVHLVDEQRRELVDA